MKSARNPLLFALLLGGLIGYIAAYNNAKPTTDAKAAPAENEQQTADAQAAPTTDDTAPSEQPKSESVATDAPSADEAEPPTQPAEQVAQETDASAGQGEVETKSGVKQPWDRQVYFGEQHLHTSASPDAFVIGVRGTWEDAYNYAMGNEITLSTTGAKIKKSTPYDFVAITDHAE